MTTFWLTWKPRKKQLEEIRSTLTAFNRDGTADDWWRIQAHKAAKTGDRAFAFRQGSGDRGIFGTGTILAAPELRPDMSPNPQKPQYFVPVRFSQLVDPMNGFLLPLDDLNDVLPPSLRDAQPAGRVVPRDVAAIIAERLGLPPEKDDGDYKQNPPWNRDELILALDAYVGWEGNPPSKASSEIEELSQTLNALRHALGTRETPTLRNANGVYMKLMNLRRHDPHFTAQGKTGLPRGNHLEEEVWIEFHDQPARLRQVANAIRASLTISTSQGGFGTEDQDLHPDEEEAVEGHLLTALHHRRERSRKIVLAKKNAVMKAMGKLACEGCGFDFRESYGHRGATFIECHHIRPIVELGDGTPTKTKDLTLLCANCHRMIHAKRPWWTLEELQVAIKSASSQFIGC